MVRSMGGLLADVARGRLPADHITRVLETGDRRRLAPKAPAKGLTLSRVEYGEPPTVPAEPRVKLSG